MHTPNVACGPVCRQSSKSASLPQRSRAPSRSYFFFIDVMKASVFVDTKQGFMTANRYLSVLRWAADTAAVTFFISRKAAAFCVFNTNRRQKTEKQTGLLFGSPLLITYTGATRKMEPRKQQQKGMGRRVGFLFCPVVISHMSTHP